MLSDIFNLSISMKKLTSLFLFITLYTGSLFAQSSLTITLIENESYQPLKNHTVIIQNNSIGFQEERITSENGRVTLSGLSTSGSYVVIVPESDDYFESRSEPVQLISNKNTSVLVTVYSRIDGRLDEITVSATSTTINTVDAQVASEITARELETLPVEGRDITRSLFRLPNISQATGFFSEAPNVAINGANSLFTNYQIDGFDNNENFLGGQRFRIPVGLTQNITTLTNNFGAEHGRTSNGIINITTKSGSNDQAGEVFFVSRPGPPLDSSSPFAQRDLSGNNVKDGFSRFQGGFSLGGPIKKDKTFYFVNAEHLTDLKDNLLNSPRLNVNTTVPGTNRFTFLSGRIDHNWNNRFRSFLRVNKGFVSVERQGGGLDGGVAFPSTGNQQDRNSLMIAQKNIYSGDGFVSETGYQYGRFRWNFANPDNPDSPNATVLGPDGQTIATLGHPGFLFDETENTHQFQQKFTFYKGNHTLKTGVDFKSSGYSLVGGGNPNGSWIVSLNQQQVDEVRGLGLGSDLTPFDIPRDANVELFGIELRPDAFEKRQNIISLYIEDQLAVSDKLNLNLGLRWDYDNLSKAGNTGNGDLNNIAPRISANYRLSSSTSFRAGYGMYYDKILYAVYSDALQFSSDSDDFRQQISEFIRLGILPDDTNIDNVTNEGNLTANVTGVDFLDDPSRESLQSQRESVFSNELRILNPDGMDNPFSHQFMVGFQHQINDHSLLYVDLMHNRSFNLFRLRDLNAPEPFPIDPDNVDVRSTEEADESRPTPVFQDEQGSFALAGGDTLRGAARSVVMTETAGRSNYYAMNLTFDRHRADKDYSFRLIYTLSFLENNTEDINFRARDANNFSDEWGPALNDRRHIINTIFTYFPFDGFSATVAALFQSGQPVNRVPDASIFGTTDLNGDGRSFSQQFVGNNDRSPGESRNSDRLPWNTTFDLNLQYALPVAGGRVVAGADIFNLLNAENLGGFSSNLTQSNQIQVGPPERGIEKRNVAPPRQFQFSLKYLF
jgi:hypothetical protein